MWNLFLVSNQSREFESRSVRGAEVSLIPDCQEPSLQVFMNWGS